MKEFSDSWECTLDSSAFPASRSGKNFKDNASLKPEAWADEEQTQGF